MMSPPIGKDRWAVPSAGRAGSVTPGALGMGTEKIIAWKTNKVRWVIFEWINGLVLSCFVFFTEQVLHPLNLSHYEYEALVLGVVPGLYVTASVLRARAKGRA